MKRPTWRPRLKLIQRPSGAYWYVVWTWDLDGFHPARLYLAEHAPFMARNSANAKAAHAFAARLNQARGLAY